MNAPEPKPPVPPEPGPTGNKAGESTARPEPAPLTPEEQMALFEKELKENDWGHQPC